MNPMEKRCRKNLVRFAVQKTMFCPDCGSILDMRRAVLLAGMKILCEGCYLLAGSPPADSDGRILWGGKSPRTVDVKTGCARHDVPKFGCKACISKRDKLQCVADEKREQLEGENE